MLRISPGTASFRRLHKIRVTLLVISIAVVILTLPIIDPVRMFIQLLSGQQSIPAIKMTDEIKKAIDYRVDLSKTLFQTTLVVLGGIWSLVLAKKDDANVVFHDNLSMGTFFCANLVLFFAGVSHIDFVMDMSSLLATASTLGGVAPNIDSTFVSASLVSQFLRVFCALAVSAFALFGAQWK